MLDALQCKYTVHLVLEKTCLPSSVMSKRPGFLLVERGRQHRGGKERSYDTWIPGGKGGKAGADG